MSMTFTILLDATMLSVAAFQAAAPVLSRAAGVAQSTLLYNTGVANDPRQFGIYDLKYVVKALKNVAKIMERQRRKHGKFLHETPCDSQL